MGTVTCDTPAAERLASARRAGLLVVAGWLLLASGVLLAGWAPVELPLGLVGLGAAALYLMWPSRALSSDTLDGLHSLTLASLITLSGFHLLA
ncbi:hypothetical protein M8009_15650 [Halomonas sp. ATCH28]|uniref:Uncharacterized protein n=1 Tax=Halomonas gemina TaxID=2945105 RepID=A0ABT0T4D9_9GAMM|nr:hypothetical protein [Halomonas gemina]MCL7941724.1 hypothetical protein [Halomonas gemina]